MRLLLNVISISILAVLVLMVYLSSSNYSYNQYTASAAASMATHSSSSGLHKFATGENGIQVCCSWGNEIADGILTYRIDDNVANQKVIQAVHQAVDEWNSKIPNIKFQEH